MNQTAADREGKKGMAEVDQCVVEGQENAVGPGGEGKKTSAVYSKNNLVLK